MSATVLCATADGMGMAAVGVHGAGVVAYVDILGIASTVSHLLTLGVPNEFTRPNVVVTSACLGCCAQAMGVVAIACGRTADAMTVLATSTE